MSQAVEMARRAFDYEQQQRLKKFIQESDAQSLMDFAVEQARIATGKEFYFGEVRGQNRKVPFTQLIYPNLDVMTKYNFLTTAEESFLLRISSMLEFGSNCLVHKDEKKAKTKKQKIQEAEAGNLDFSELKKTASVSYIAEVVGLSRQRTSSIMNSLKSKGILATAETGMVTENGRVCTSRTWFVNPNVLYCGDKDAIEVATQRIFSQSLKYIVSENGEKIKLPIRLFA